MIKTRYSISNRAEILAIQNPIAAPLQMDGKPSFTWNKCSIFQDPKSPVYFTLWDGRKQHMASFLFWLQLLAFSSLEGSAMEGLPIFTETFQVTWWEGEKKPQHTQRTVHQTFCILALIHKNYFQISYYFTVHEVTRRNSECLTAAVPDCHLQRWFFIFVWWKSFTCKLNTSFPRCWYNKSHFMPVFL